MVDVVRSPGYATAVGLVKYGAKHLAREYAHAPPRNLYQRATKRMGDWLKEVL